MERCKSIKIEKGTKFIKIEKGSRSIKIEKSDFSKRNIRKIERDKYGGCIKMEVLLNENEGDSESIAQLKREIRCLTRANTSAEIGTEIWRKNYTEMERKFLMLKEMAIYEKEVEAYKLENSELLALVEEKTRECAALEEKLNELMKSSRNDVVVDGGGESNGLQMVCSSSKVTKRVTEVEEEKDGGELSLCLWNGNGNGNDKCVQLERKNMELELENRRLEENQAVVCEREAVALSKITDLCREIQKLESEKQDMSTFSEKKRMECVEFEGKLNVLALKKGVGDSELRSLKSKCGKLQERVKQLEQGKPEREKNGQEQILSLSKVQGKCDQLKKRNRELEKEKNELSSKKDVVESELNGLKTERSKLKEQILCLSDVKDKCDQLQRRNRELEDEKNELSSKKDVVENELNGWKIDHTKLKERVIQLEQGNRVLCEKEKNAENRCDQLQRQNRELEVEKNELSSKKDVVESELNGLKTERSKLRERVTQLEEGNRLLCEKEKNVEGNYELLQRKYRDLELAKNELSSKKDIAGSELIGLKSERSKLKERVAHLEEVNKVLCEKEKNAQEQILCLSNVKDKCEQLKRQNSELELEKNELSSRKDVVDNALNGLEIECSKLKDRVAQLEEENSVLCEKEKNGQEQIMCLSNVKDKCEELELQKNTLEKELSDNKIAQKDLTAQISHLKDQQALVCQREKVALNRRQGKQPKASADLDCEATSTVGGGKSNPIDIESDDEDSLGRDDEHLISCKKECPLSSTPKRKRDAEVGASEVKTEDELNLKKFNAGLNVLLERFSMEVQTPTVSSQSQSIGENKGWHKRTSHVMGIHGKESKWRTWMALHLALRDDPELCLKAICALCRQQALKKKPSDEVRGMELGKLLMDGNMSGDLKKSVEELEQMDPSLLKECRTLALGYSEQLFNIYEAKEDPFFCE